MPVPVNVFNPNQFTIQVSINRGDQVSIPGTSAAQNWQPQLSAQNPWSFSDNMPGPNTLGGYGGNQIIISRAGGEPQMLRVDIPRVQILSLQLYVFLGEQSSWTLLNNGQAIASGTF